MRKNQSESKIKKLGNVIRQAILNDANQISDINLVARKDGYKGIIDQSYLDSLKSTPERIERFKNKILSDAKNILVYEENGVVLGFIHGGESRDNGLQHQNEIYAFYVHPDNQKKGIGTKLFNAFFKKYGTVPISLRTLIGSKGESFYKKMKGQLDGERLGEIGGKMYREVRYIWKK